MACEMLEKVETSGGKVDTFIMDNCQSKGSSQSKDIQMFQSNHTKKGFTGALVELNSANSFKEC